MVTDRRMIEKRVHVPVFGGEKDIELEKLYENDEKLKEMLAQRNKGYEQIGKLEKQIGKRKTELAKKSGRVAATIDDLMCEKHPGIHFEIIDKIKDSSIFNPKNGPLNIYQCVQCGSEKPIVKTRAYDCPKCGIVLGDFLRQHYKSPEESWRALAGREGEHYHCRICTAQLGENYWKMS